jgi:hypothetical protein
VTTCHRTDTNEQEGRAERRGPLLHRPGLAAGGRPVPGPVSMRGRPDQLSAGNALAQPCASGISYCVPGTSASYHLSCRSSEQEANGLRVGIKASGLRDCPPVGPICNRQSAMPPDGRRCQSASGSVNLQSTICNLKCLLMGGAGSPVLPICNPQSAMPPGMSRRSFPKWGDCPP